MIKVNIVACNVEDTMRIVREVREWGLIQGEDFDFAYHPPRYYDRAPSYDSPSQAEFRFYEEQYATMFKLKYL